MGVYVSPCTAGAPPCAASAGTAVIAHEHATTDTTTIVVFFMVINRSVALRSSLARAEDSEETSPGLTMSR